MNKILLTGLAISWRVDYDEKGEYHKNMVKQGKLIKI